MLAALDHSSENVDIEGGLVDLKKSLASALLCLAIIGAGARPGSAQQVQPLEPEWLRQMYAEGWQKVQEGVLQRDTGGGEFERFSYGAEGLQWLVQRYEQQVADLRSRYDASPSEDLAELIEHLEGEILRREGTLDSEPSADAVSGEELEMCEPSYGGTTFAGPQVGSPGVTARATAYFHDGCGYVGDTFTTAYAQATSATGETILRHSDPKNGGTWLESYSSASANGSTGCESKAEASVTVYYPDLSVTYLTPEKLNFSCQPAETTSTYTLDSTSWAQTGNGNLGSLTLNSTSDATLIGSNYSPIATSGLPQAGISFAKSTVSKLEGQPVDTVSAFANAPVIKVEFTGRLRETPAATTVLIGLGHWISGTGSYGLRIATDQLQRLVVSSLSGTSTFTVHQAGVTLVLNETTNDSYRWVWTENSPGSSTGTAQWWRKISGTWQTWGTSKTDMRRPVGHASTRFRLHAHENGGGQAVGFDFLETSLTFGAR
ncbi:MAG TPA: hypothetical protein VJ885_06870 [Thermoanaerobaculia bacterium]|nr:hypothetical protein [Thermoanaerobaculia bacterium]